METVLAVRTEVLKDYIKCKPYNLIKDDNKEIFNLIKDNYVFLPRMDLETDTNYRQVIPYCIIHHNDQYLLFKRLKGQSESRLHAMLSLGAGGHINLRDLSSSFERIIYNGLHRELNEEISIVYDLDNDLSYIGVINDESCVVSRSHIGFLFELTLRSGQYKILEVDKMSASWEIYNGLIEKRNKFEDWTKIVFDQYVKVTWN